MYVCEMFNSLPARSLFIITVVFKYNLILRNKIYLSFQNVLLSFLSLCFYYVTLYICMCVIY